MKPIAINEFQEFFESLENLAQIENSNLTKKELLSLINTHYLISKKVFSFQIKELQYGSALTDRVQRIVEALRKGHKVPLVFLLREINMGRDTYYKKVKYHTFTRNEYDEILAAAHRIVAINAKSLQLESQNV